MTELTQEELRDEVERVYQNSLTRKYWGFIGRGLARLIGKKGEAPLWISILVVMLIIQVLAQILLVVFKKSVADSPVSIQNSYPMVIYIWFSTIVFRALVENYFEHLKTTLVDALNLPTSGKTFTKWLNMIGQTRIQAIGVLIFTALFSSTSIFVIYSQNNRIPELTDYVFTFLVFLQIAFHMYWIFIAALTFVFWIRDWKFILFQDDPSKSHVMQVLHQVSSRILFVVALLMALNIILVIPLKLYSQLYMAISISIFWAPALVFFWMSESSFSHLAVEAKFERLNAIQRQIMEIENTQDLKQKESADAVQRLLDLHDRVKAVPVSMINLNSITNLLGSLALPLLAFLINIFDIWQKLFQTP